MDLLAKSASADEDPSSARLLKQHIDDCLLIWEMTKKAFPKVASAAGMSSTFWEALRLSIVLHDLGKAHPEFQLLLKKKPNRWGHQRHELFSIPFVDAALDRDKHLCQLVKWVVAGHHKDYDTLLDRCRQYKEPASFGMLNTLDEGINSYQKEFKKIDISLITTLLNDYGIKIEKVIPESINKLIAGYLRNPIKSEHKDFLNLILLLGGLKWCDHLGSALLRELNFITNKDFYFLDQRRQLLQRKGLDFYEHQLKCGQSTGNLILTAPTGSGKTEAALLWLRQQLNNSGQGRIFYILPFTASINAMYERLKKGLGEGKTGMLHGKLNEYLNNYFDDYQYSVSDKKARIVEVKNQFKSILTPLKVVTPFQLLKHLYGLKGYEQGVFEMTGCYLIFDEIHAYSPEVFAQIKLLLEFLIQHLKAKVMIMTATMPRFLRKELEKSIGSFITIQANNELFRLFTRHRIELRNGLLSDGLTEIKKELKAGRKVLVVCNTVKSAQLVYKKLKSAVTNQKALLLHGSFSGIDRAKKEKLLTQENIQLLVGTQAIEVSLDIDYDLIFTEPAPIDALIQRFGRVNRGRHKGICPCIVFKQSEESDSYIYDLDIVTRTIRSLENIVHDKDGIIDEGLLQQSIDEVYPDWNEKEKKIFNEQYKNLQVALSLLSPLRDNKFTEDDFYKQFDGIKVLPQANKAAFETHLNNFDFINAESLQVQIRKGRYIKWRNEGYIQESMIVVGNNKKCIPIRYLITNKKYCNDLGLISDEEEGWANTEIL